MPGSPESCNVYIMAYSAGIADFFFGPCLEGSGKPDPRKGVGFVSLGPSDTFASSACLEETLCGMWSSSC